MDQRILAIQQKLSDLRQDRSRFFTVQNVMEIYTEFKAVIDAMTPLDLEKLDSVIADCLLMFSLAFNTVGFTRQPIAVYAKAITLETVFRFISRDPSFTPKELSLLKSSIRSVKESLTMEDDGDIPVIEYVNTSISKLMKQLDAYGENSSKIMSTLPEEEYPVYSQITHMRRYILAEVISNDFSAERFDALRTKLERIQSHVEHQESIQKAGDKGASDQTAGNSSAMSPLLRYQFKKASILVELFKNGVSKEEMDKESKELDSLYATLKEILPVLDVFVMTRRWTLRVADLFQHMKSLLRIIPYLLIDEETTSYRSSDPVFVPINEHLKYRYLITYMARRAWALIFKLLDTTEPVSEALYSMYNQLLTMKRCLGEVKLAGGISNLRELYPYQLKLASLDNHRVDGKFVVGNEVPPGQGVLNSMLAECFDMVYELKVDLEEKGGDEADDSNIAEEDNDDDCVSVNNQSCQSDIDECSSVETSSKVSLCHLDSHGDETPHEDHPADVTDGNE